MAIGSLAVRVSSDTTNFNQGMASAGGTAKKFGAEAADVGKKVAVMGAAVAAAGAAIGIELTRRGLEAVDSQAKLARQLGGTIDGLKGLQIAGSDAGVSSEILGRAMEKLNSRLGEAQRGSGSAYESFDRLGLSAQALSDMDVDERVATIADRMKEMGLSTQEAGDELRQMGIRNGEMVNLMIQGGDAIRRARTEVAALGLSLSAVDAAQVEAANDSFARIGLVVEGISQRMAVEFAPILDAVSRMMVEAGTDGVDMGEAIGDGFNMGIKAAAFMMNAVEGIKRTFEVAGKGVALFGLGLVDVMLTAADAIVNKPVRAINELINAMNNIPGIDIDAVSLSGFGASIESELKTVRLAQEIGMQDIRDTLLAPLPGMKFEQFIAESRANAVAAAEEMAGIGDLLQPDLGGGSGPGRKDDKAEDEAERKREELARKLEVIREANLTERELTLEKYAIENEDLALALEQQLITRDEWAALAQGSKERQEAEMTAIEKEASEARVQLAEQEAQAKQQAMSAAMGNLSTLMNTGSKKLFKIGKAAALAGALIDGYAAIVGAYKVGASIGGPALGAAYGVAAGAATFAQISAIKSQSFNGGGGTASGGSAGMSNPGAINANSQPVQSQQRPQTVANVTLVGDVFSRSTVMGLMDQMNELSDDGMRMRIA
jgi:hypothetical protein